MRYKFYQDPDTGNCYAQGKGLLCGVGPVRDSVNAPVAMMELDPWFLDACLVRVSKDKVKKDHPRLLAYLDDDLDI